MKDETIETKLWVLTACKCGNSNELWSHDYKCNNPNYMAKNFLSQQGESNRQRAHKTMLLPLSMNWPWITVKGPNVSISLFYKLDVNATLLVIDVKVNNKKFTVLLHSDSSSSVVYKRTVDSLTISCGSSVCCSIDLVIICKNNESNVKLEY